MKTLSASIVIYKTAPADLNACILSTVKCDALKLLLVVNNSPSNSSCPQSFCHLDYCHIPTNPGYGAAHNVAIRKAQAHGFKYHLIINPDVSFDADILSPLIDYMEQHENVGMIMPKVLNPDGSIQRLCKLLPTPADLFTRRFLPKAMRDKNNKRFEMHEMGYDRIAFVPSISGCFMLVRLSAVQEVGMFDERFFMYGEDIDFSRRMAEKYDTVYYPHVSVVHQHGAASYKSFRMLAVHTVNICRYFNKWGWFKDELRDRLNKKATAQYLTPPAA